MPKKTKSIKPVRNPRSKQDDFFFFMVVSVFAILTIFAASYVNTARQKAIQASQKPATVDVAPLDFIRQPANITPANPPKYQNPSK